MTGDNALQNQANTAEHDTISAALTRAHTREEAMREILSAISRYRDDVQPVLECIARNAGELCDAPDVGLHLVNEARTHTRIACVWGPDKGVFPVGTEFDLSGTTAMARAIRKVRTTQIRDFSKDPRYLAREPGPVKKVEEEGVLTFLCVPFVQNGIAIGCVNLNRYVMKPFTEDEIALLETFAAQAVIAIENVRQFRELQTRLEREAATSEVLSIISQSREDERPVFDAILDNALRLCGSATATLFLVDRDQETLYEAAARGHVPEEIQRFTRENPPRLDDKSSSFVQAFEQRKPVQILDAADTPRATGGPSQRQLAVEKMGIRTILQVPLMQQDQPIGVLSIYRTEVQAYSENEIALLKTFAAQAVIAIENVRQFREVQERLSREAATSEVLKVISQSRSDTQPVFHMILKKALALCDARLASMWLVSEDGRSLSMDVESSIEIEKEAHPGDNSLKRSMEDDASSLVRTVKTGKIDHDLDLLSHERYRDPSHPDQDWYTRNGIRTSLIVPLSAGQHQVGCILIYRTEVRTFTPDQIELVKSFAAQAVIAIENVRQFKALETLNAELGERVKQQVGEIERMGKLKRFLPSAVADAVVSSGSEKMLSSHRALLGVLFCDIRGFTAFCETAEPEETIEVLQTYHEEMGKLIDAHGAGVDHRMGDGIMVLFNDPLPCEDPAGAAMKLAIAMRARMSDLCRAWKRMGYRLGFGVGVSLGYATVGMVGFEGRSDYTASGTAINLASRLCDEAEDGEILLSTRAAIAVEDMFPSVSAGEVSLKGIREPVEVFRLDSADEVA